jgi:hypothetical protein
MTRRRSLILSIVTAGCWIILLAIVLSSVFAAGALSKQTRRIGKPLRLDDRAFAPPPSSQSQSTIFRSGVIDGTGAGAWDGGLLGELSYAFGYFCCYCGLDCECFSKCRRNPLC